MTRNGLSQVLAVGLSAATAACGCPQRGTQLLARDATPQASPNPLDFGRVPVGQLETLPLQLKNVGILELKLGQVSITQGGASAQFAVVTSFPATIDPGASATATVQFAPLQSGEQTATLVIPSNSAGAPVYEVPLLGNGVDVVLGVQPTALNFGPLEIGTTKTLPLTFTNQGSSLSDAIVVSPTTGTQAAEFAWTGTPGALPPSGSFSLQVTFAPTVVGSASASIPYQPCATCAAQQISLLGVGIDGQLVFAPNPIALSSPLGSKASVPVTVTNIGAAPVSLLTLAPQGSLGALGLPFSYFSVKSLPIGFPLSALTLAPNVPLPFTVVYSPSGSVDLDTLVATYQVSGGPQKTSSDPLLGNAPINGCSLGFPPALSFGDPAVGTSVQKSVTLTNAGQTDCAVTAIALAPSSDASFALAPPAATSVTVAAGGSATIPVACDIASQSAPFIRNGLLTFQSNDPLQPTGAVMLNAYLAGSSPYAAGWPKWHNDNTNRGQSEADTSANKGTIVWKFPVALPAPLNGTVNDQRPTYMNSPVVDGQGNVYQIGMDGTFYAIDPGGKQIWSTSLLSPATDPHPATPILAADGTIYLETGTDNTPATGKIFHLSAATGQILYQADPPIFCDAQKSMNSCVGPDGFDVCPSLGNDGLLFDGDDYGQTVTYALPGDGSLALNSQLILGPYHGSPTSERVGLAIDKDDNSYWCSYSTCFGVGSPEVAGFQPLWGWPTAGAPAAPATTFPPQSGSWCNTDLALDENGTGYLMLDLGCEDATTGATTISAMDTKDGSIVWSHALPQFSAPNPIDFASASYLYSADVGNGAPAISDDGWVYVGSGDGLYAFDVKTGHAKAGFPFKCANVDSAPAIGGDGTIFFGASDGAFYAVNQGGTLRYKVVTYGPVSSSPAIGSDGTVFFVSDDGNLYAVQ